MGIESSSGVVGNTEEGSSFRGRKGKGGGDIGMGWEQKRGGSSDEG